MLHWNDFKSILFDVMFHFMFFLQVLIEHLEEQNVDGFTDAVKEYDSISRLDQWYTSILLRIKKQVNDNPDLRWLPPTQTLFVAPHFKVNNDPFLRFIVCLIVIYYCISFYVGKSAFDSYDNIGMDNFMSLLYDFNVAILLKLFVFLLFIIVSVNFCFNKYYKNSNSIMF